MMTLWQRLKYIQRQNDFIIRALVHIHKEELRAMFDNTKILAATARLEASDAKALAILKEVRDQNKAEAAEILDLKAQIAAGGDTTQIQADMDAIATRLNATADAVDTGVADNPAVPNLPPAQG